MQPQTIEIKTLSNQELKDLWLENFKERDMLRNRLEALERNLMLFDAESTIRSKVKSEPKEAEIVEEKK